MTKELSEAERHQLLADDGLALYIEDLRKDRADLLAACKAFVSLYDRAPIHGMSQTYKLARLAIAKVEGRNK